jgi:hypothetical protein
MITMTVAAVISNIWWSIAANSSTSVLPGPVTYTRRPGGGARRAAVSRTPATESAACDVPNIPDSRSMTSAARPSRPRAADAVIGSAHKSVTE